jgi:quercetin dioxygenase-like cupin family protein
MKLLRSADRDWTEGKGYRKRPLVTERELGIEGSFIQEVMFHPGESVPLHYHERTKEINGEQLVMEPEDVLICEPGDVHGNPVIERGFRILVVKVGYDPEDTVWLG